jgi:hypothetical protein
MANLSLRNLKITIMAVMMVSAFAKTLNLIVEPKGKSIDTWSCKLFYKMGNIPSISSQPFFGPCHIYKNMSVGIDWKTLEIAVPLRN